MMQITKKQKREVLAEAIIQAGMFEKKNFRWK